MAEWPQLYRRVELIERDNVSATGEPLGSTHWAELLSVATTPGMPLRPDTWDLVAAWCGGTRLLGDDGAQEIAIGSLDPAARARLGDWVMEVEPRRFVVERGVGHGQRWAPAEAAGSSP